MIFILSGITLYILKLNCKCYFDKLSMEVGSIIRDVFTSGAQEIICDRVHSLWTKRYNVWCGLPLTLVLSKALQVPEHLRDLNISYTICTKDNRPLMAVELLSG